MHVWVTGSSLNVFRGEMKEDPSGRNRIQRSNIVTWRDRVVVGIINYVEVHWLLRIDSNSERETYDTVRIICNEESWLSERCGASRIGNASRQREVRRKHSQRKLIPTALSDVLPLARSEFSPSCAGAIFIEQNVACIFDKHALDEGTPQSPPCAS